MKKIVFISNIIAPYRVPFFNELSKCKNIALNVLYVALSEKNRTWNEIFKIYFFFINNNLKKYFNSNN